MCLFAQALELGHCVAPPTHVVACPCRSTHFSLTLCPDLIAFTTSIKSSSVWTGVPLTAVIYLGSCYAGSAC